MNGASVDLSVVRKHVEPVEWSAVDIRICSGTQILQWTNEKTWRYLTQMRMIERKPFLVRRLGEVDTGELNGLIRQQITEGTTRIGLGGLDVEL